MRTLTENEWDEIQETRAKLLGALERHVKMFELVCDKVNFGASFLDAKTIAEWNDASLQATAAIRTTKEDGYG